MLIAVIRIVKWWDSRGQGFRLYKIQETIPYDARWDVAYTPQDVQDAGKVLSQPFHYLGHGFQCYAFCSADDKYVLKFFRYQRLRLPNFIMAVPEFPLFSEWRKSRLLALARRKDYLLRSCKTSWDLARQETCLLMVHLNATKGLFPVVKITDSLGNTFDIDLDNYQFMLQKKAQLIKPTILGAVQKGNTQEAKKYIESIFSLLLHCAMKGIRDTDGALIRKNNLGFYEGKAIYIDGGKLSPWNQPCTKKDFQKDLKRLRPLRKWLQLECPSLVSHFDTVHKQTIDVFDQYSTQLASQTSTDVAAAQ
jgi:hypothetical protein